MCDNQGAHARTPCELKGRGDGIVAVLGFLRALNNGVRQGDLGQDTLVLGLLGGLSDHRVYFVSDSHSGCLCC